MAIPAPVILLPSGGVDYTTDTRTQTLSGTTSANTKQIKVNGSQFGISYTPGETVWSWTGILDYGVTTIQVTAVEKVTNDVSPPATIHITVIQGNLVVSVSAPTGISLKRYQDKIQVITQQNPEPNVIGYNFYVSYQSGGVNNNYVKINSQLVTDTSFYEDTTKLISQTVNSVGNIRVTTTTEEIDRVYFYSVYFDKTIYSDMVTQGLLPDVGFNQDTPFYFVITAVIYDPIVGQSTESTYSLELEGSPITITTGIQDLPARTQSDIILTYTQELLDANAGIDMKPGTVLRDITDPVSEEQARTYIIQDFLSRALSVSSLQDFDDANGDGVSDPVDQSVQKKALQIALYLNDPNSVQQLINDQFDKLAANVNVTRQGALSAVGTVTFYTSNPPIRDMTVNEGSLVSTLGDVDQGILAQNYRCVETKTLTFADRGSFYNSATQRYELSVSVEAVTAGALGNTDSYTIKTIGSGIDSDFLVENPNPISFGQDQESNHNLAGRIMLAFFADTGTEGGYARTAADVLGVQDVRVEKAGDSLMFRDYDSIRREHIGGKVDIYIQGTRITQVSDQIAFSYENGTGGLLGEQFSVANAITFQFKTNNPRVTAHTPIFEVSQVYNSTRASAYDLNGYRIVGNGDIIELDNTLSKNIQIGLASEDIIKVDYKYRSSDVFILNNQPVESIVSVVGQLSGALPSSNWQLVKLQDPLEDGYSTIASDGLQIIFANGLPLTEFQSVTDEPHVLVQGVAEPLRLLGIDPLSIVVTSSDDTITYVKDQDYTITSGSVSVATTIMMIDSGRIENGQQVNVNYVAIENFTVTYTVNSLLGNVQGRVDQMKHACADVIVKDAIQNKVDFVLTIIPKSGVSNFETLTSQIQTAIANYVAEKPIGSSLTQSEVVHAIQSVSDVDYVVLPFIKMVKADGSLIIRDDVGNPTFEVFNQGSTVSYITKIPVLTYNTTDQGGPSNLFRGVFENNLPLVLQTDPLEVSNGPGRAYIQGDGKIIISTKDGNLPDANDYQVAYYTKGEAGSKDIQVASLEYLMIGAFSVTFDTPRMNSKQSL
jgi:uncharacterized phage protein gp47/JayE